MKTVSVSEIIRTAQMGNTLYVLASEAQERERMLVEALKEIAEDNCGCCTCAEHAKAALAAKEE